MLVLCFALSLAAPADPGTVAAPSVSQEDTMPVVLDDSIPGAAAVRDELSLRLGGREVVLVTTPRDAPPSAFFWVGAGPSSDAGILVQVIVSDGRLYERQVRQPPAGEEARVVAGALGNLIDGIAERRLRPTRTAVEVPSIVQTKDAAPERGPEPEAVPVTVEETDVRQPPKPRRAVAAAWGQGGLALGLGPPSDVTGPSAAGGGVGGAWIRSGGLSLGGSVRVASWRRGGVRLTRLRIAFEAGYLRTWGWGSIGLRGGPFVEPIWIDTHVRRPSGRARPNAPLVGVQAVVSPRVRVVDKAGYAVWLGPEIEAGVAAEAARPFGVVRVLRDADTPLLRAGGAELALGLALELRLLR